MSVLCDDDSGKLSKHKNHWNQRDRLVSYLFILLVTTRLVRLMIQPFERDMWQLSCEFIGVLKRIDELSLPVATRMLFWSIVEFAFSTPQGKNISYLLRVMCWWCKLKWYSRVNSQDVISLKAVIISHEIVILNQQVESFMVSLVQRRSVSSQVIKLAGNALGKSEMCVSKLRVRGLTSPHFLLMSLTNLSLCVSAGWLSHLTR
jgi:hypothetical protein